MDEIKQEDQEDLWGYAKRIGFVRDAIAAAFPDRPAAELHVLDIGCGNGSQLTLPLARHGFQITGIDTDQRSIDHARRISKESSNANFRGATAAELATEGKFDVVILSETLEHTDNPQKLLMDGVACLSADGIVIVTVPNGYGEFEMDSWIFRMLRLQKLVEAMARSPGEATGSTDNQECGHVQFFTRGQLRKLFAACGLVPFREGAASFLAGPIVGHLVARSDRLISWNARVTESLPLVMASGWYFALRRRDHGTKALR
jgi:SAM-dependent methyltransferase